MMLHDVATAGERTPLPRTGAALRVWLRRYRVVGGAFLIVLLLGLPTLIVPFYTDQSVFALAARTILSGGMPYRDLWDVKSPGIYFIYTLAFLPLGQHMVSIRILDLANTALAMVAIYLLGRRFFGERAGVLAGCLYGVTYLTRAGYEGLGQTESFLALPVVLSILLYRPNASRGAGAGAFFSGVLLGLAFSLKMSAVFFVFALPAIELIFAERPLRVAPALKRLSVAAVGFLAVVAVFGVYLAAGGALRDFIDIQRLHVWPYTSLRWSPPGESYLHFLARATRDYIRDNLFLVVPAAGAAFLALAGLRRKEIVLVAIVAVASLAGVWSQGKFFDYQWLAMIFPLALLAGFAIDRVVAYVSAPGVAQRWAAYGLAGAFLVLLTPGLLANPYEQYRQFLGYATGRTSQADNEAKYTPNFSLDREMLAYVDANGGNDKSLFIWGNWPVIYWWAGQPLVSRFIYDTGLSAHWAPSSWRDELVAGLRAKPPHFIAVAGSYPQPWLTGTNQTTVEALAAYPGLSDLLAQSYQATWANNLFRVYVRK